ncbi:MAG: hypothetical protein MUO54_09385 [Anaerolineales bacterium]|nr:hypothetical protein [Anaerolineales bacterium]
MSVDITSLNKYSSSGILVLALILASLISCRSPVEYRRSPSQDSIEPTWTSPATEESPTLAASPTIESELLIPLNSLPPSADLNSGQVLGFQDTFGLYFLYRPTTPSNPPQTLVVIHGTPAVDLSAGETTFN